MQQDQQQEDSSEEMNNSISILQKTATMYAEQLMSDICLVVGANRYPAHRVILCASSEVFQVMLMKPEWNECRESVIELKEDPKCTVVFPQFLKYLYVGKIKISIQTSMPMLALADKYNIKDLTPLCVDYMEKHIAKAATLGCFVSWLQYTIAFSPYHKELTESLKRFLKYNFEIIASAADFGDLDGDILVVLLQQNDIVVKSEYDLFGYVEKWLLNKQEQIEREQDLSDEEKQQFLLNIIETIIVCVRFAMMTPREIAKILLRPIINLHKEFFVERLAIGMSYHSGQIDHVKQIIKQESGQLQFTPRLYTTDKWGLSMTIKEYEKIENYQSFVYCFFSQNNLSEHQQEDQSTAWEIEFFPRGVRFQKAKLIGIFSSQLDNDIPENIKKTVRLRVNLQEKWESDEKFMIGVLISGVQNAIQHIKSCHVRTHYFSTFERALNIDNLIPYEELELSTTNNLSPYLVGDNRDTLQLHVIITPLGKFTSYDTPPFDF